MYLAVVGLGLAAIVVDRLIGSGASDAPARAQASPSTSTRGTPARGSVPADVRVEAAPFPRDLPIVPAGLPTRDPFAPPPEFVPKPPPGRGPDRPGSVPDTVVTPPSALFAQAHRLSAVLAGGPRGIVVVDGELVEVGQSVDECTLTAVADIEATFTCKDGPITLSVSSDAGSQR
jgi:hypothetical protein